MQIQPSLNRLKQKKTRQFLRIKQTDTEAILWKFLRRKELNIKFYRQFGIENYIADFCCRGKKLIVEIDGRIHENEEVRKNDLQRTKNLESFGYKIIRFKNEEILNDLEKVLKKIKSFLWNPSPQAPSPSY